MSDKAPKDSEQHAAEADVEAVEDKLGPFVIAAETTRMPMVFTDACEPDHPIIFANDAFLKLTGYDRDEVMAQSFNFLLGAGTDAVRTEIEAGCPKAASRGINRRVISIPQHFSSKVTTLPCLR